MDLRMLKNNRHGKSTYGKPVLNDPNQKSEMSIYFEMTSSRAFRVESFIQGFEMIKMALFA